VEFEAEFVSIPKVVIASRLLDFQGGLPTGHNTEVHDVTTDGFTIRFYALV
jgi:hypothetical protein